MIKFPFVHFQAETDAPQGTQRGELSEKQLYELIPTVKITDSIVAFITVYTFLKLVSVHILQQLREDVFAYIHSFAIY
jgi:hypothetical protein